MNYSDLVTFIGSMFQIPVVNAATAAPFQDPNANTILPRVIDFAEQMIYTDMDFLATRQQVYMNGNTPITFTPGSRSLTLPTGVMVVEGIALITPASAASPDQGTRNTLEMVSLDVIDMFYPSVASPQGVSAYYGMKDATTIVVAMTPDQAYLCETTGTFRPAPISSTNSSTYMSTYYPQLLMAAIAYYMAGYQRDFGAQSEDPKLASSWKSTYDYILPTCVAEEKRRKGESVQTSRTSSEAPPTNPGA